MPFTRAAPPLALSASVCPEGVGVDFLLRLPAELTRRVLMSLPARQLGSVARVSHAWAVAALDEALWAGAYDVSFGDDAAEYLAAISVPRTLNP